MGQDSVSHPSAREAEIVKLASLGLTDKEIARRLQIGSGTVRTYWERLRSKMGAVNRAEIISRLISQSFEQAQAGLDEAKQQLEEIQENSPVGLAVFKPSGEAIYSNRAFRTLVATKDERLPSFKSMFPALALRDVWSAAPHSSFATTINVTGHLQPVTLMANHVMCGSDRCLLISIMGSGSVAAKDTALYRSLFEDSEEATVLLSRTGVVLIASKAAESLLQSHHRKLVARRFVELVDSNDSLTFERVLQRVVSRPGSRSTLKCRLRANLADHALTVTLENRTSDVAFRGVAAVLSLN